MAFFKASSPISEQCFLFGGSPPSLFDISSGVILKASKIFMPFTTSDSIDVLAMALAQP